MVGLEQLEIHSKSYIVRWIKVEPGHTISWSIQPHKKSINFGIFKHPGVLGTNNITTPAFEETSNFILQTEPIIEKTRRASSLRNDVSSSRNDASTAQEQLKSKGFIIIQWYGKCEADKVSKGTYAVLPGNGGMYGLIVDNTFSKQLSKTATLVILTYPSNAPPKSTHHPLSSPTCSLVVGRPGIGRKTSMPASATGSVDSLQYHSSATTVAANISRVNSVFSRGVDNEKTVNHSGVLSKRRRKKGQGYASRFFSLDVATCTLSYYYNRNSSTLRGAIPLSLAAITADKRRKEISIDAGAEIWHLRAENARDFEEWTKALENASNLARRINLEPINNQKSRVSTSGLHSLPSYQEEEQEWEQVEALVSRVVGTRDAIHRLFKETNSRELRRNATLGIGLSTCDNSASGEDTDYFNQAAVTEKKSFWRRKCSSSHTTQNLGRTQWATSSAMTSATDITASGFLTPSIDYSFKNLSNQEINMHEHCSALLNDLNAVLSDFSSLLARSKRRRTISKPAQRSSIDSTSTISTAEFFDAEPGHLDHSQIYRFSRESEDDLQLSDPDEAGDELNSDASSLSSAGSDKKSSRFKSLTTLFPSRPKTLDPLPIKLVIKRRMLIPPATVQPPSLISFLRKNVGKDLSTISMPVSANEPTSLLQRIAEQLEYAQLLDKAITQNISDHRLCFVTAFVISNFSINRCKERAIRKPFNPMLGETFELLRSDEEVPGAFRFLAEKVSHRPVRIACQADSINWSISQSPMPTNKFWGKSAEIITEGRVRLVLHLPDGQDEFYSWTVASAFLRNVVMGEKYVEPVGSTTVINESTGSKAIVEFKRKGMFSGRSEDVEVKLYGPNGENSSTSLTGMWTSSLRMAEAGKLSDVEIWRVGELVDNASQRYGLTKFAAGLNEITQIERDRIPITDCRLRPDQRAAETGDLDQAERIKAILEEKQRIRRTEMEKSGETWKPRWFVRVQGGDEGEEVWKLKSGKDGYWEERTRGTWTGAPDIFTLL